MTDGVARVMRAVARAHRHTGAPITVHTHPGTQTGLAVKKLMCDEEGVDPTPGGARPLRRQQRRRPPDALADEGFILGMDRFGLNVETTFEARADTVVEMCRRGYADRMVLSHDAACYIDWIDPNVLAMMTQWNYLHIHDDVLPYLREHGVTEDQIDTMLVDDAAPLLREQRGLLRRPLRAVDRGPPDQQARHPQWKEAGSTHRQPTFILVVPLFHVTGCVPVMLSCFSIQLKLVMLHRWDPDKALELIERQQGHRVRRRPDAELGPARVRRLSRSSTPPRSSASAAAARPRRRGSSSASRARSRRAARASATA